VAIRCTAKHEAFLLMVRGASNVIKVIRSTPVNVVSDEDDQLWLSFSASSGKRVDPSW